MISVGKGLRLCKASLRTLFIYTSTRKKERTVQIIVHPFRCWEPRAAQHQQASHQDTAHGADPVHGKIIQHFGL